MEYLSILCPVYLKILEGILQGSGYQVMLHFCLSAGQTECTNEMLEQYLRCFSSFSKNDWAFLLPMTEFAYNNSVYSATDQAPFLKYRTECILSLKTKRLHISVAKTKEDNKNDKIGGGICFLSQETRYGCLP